MVKRVSMADRGLEAEFEEICERGRTAAEGIENGCWVIGDLACDIADVAKYGENAVERFAKAINVPLPTVKQYCGMSRFYQKDTRVSFLKKHPNITYTHMRDAKRLKTEKLALEFLEEVSRNHWSPNEAKQVLDEQLGISPRKIILSKQAEAAFDLDPKTSELTVTLKAKFEPFEHLEFPLNSRPVRVVIYELRQNFQPPKDEPFSASKAQLIDLQPLLGRDKAEAAIQRASDHI